MRRRIAMWLSVSLVLFCGCSSPPPAMRPLEGTPPPRQGALRDRWLRNQVRASMWSGPADQPGVISFGETSAPFCLFEERDQHGDRLYVFNPYSQNYFWIDEKVVEPAVRPEVRPHLSKPGGQNCADAIFEE